MATHHEMPETIPAAGAWSAAMKADCGMSTWPNWRIPDESDNQERYSEFLNQSRRGPVDDRRRSASNLPILEPPDTYILAYLSSGMKLQFPDCQPLRVR